MIITICGSATFAEEMGKAAEHLKKKGHEIYVPDPLVTEEWYQKNNGRENLLAMKPVWTKFHFKRIESSDAILIINHEKKGIKGYFGSNTLMELSVAIFLQKKIFLLNPIHEDHPHYEELIAVDSVVLHGNLDNI
ncbi:MAG: hypothetical protein PHI73_00105 [Patescibacteria group bacterium]|nr:hypothetical protein [Patescibacteria group bacterium]